MSQLCGVPLEEDWVREAWPASGEVQTDVAGVHEGQRAHIKKVPSPDGAVLISCNDAGFAMSKAGATAVRGVDVTGKVIKQLPGDSIHEADVPI